MSALFYNYHKAMRSEARSILFDRPGTGHNFPYEAPDFVLGVVRQALAGSR